MGHFECLIARVLYTCLTELSLSTELIQLTHHHSLGFTDLFLLKSLFNYGPAHIYMSTITFGSIEKISFGLGWRNSYHALKYLITREWALIRVKNETVRMKLLPLVKGYSTSIRYNLYRKLV